MRIFVTGGTGFIGRRLLETLAGHEVLAVSRRPLMGFPAVSWLRGDLGDLNVWFPRVRAFEPEVCAHLAWSGLPDYSYANNRRNLQMGLDVFDALCRINIRKIIVTGTCFEYGNLSGCVEEHQRPNRAGLFAAFKDAQRAIGETLFGAGGKSFLWVRPFFVYGPGQRNSSLIPTIAANLTNGAPLDIRTPDALNDFIHVVDVASGLATLVESNAPAGIYNLGTGRPSRVREVVDLVARQKNRVALLPQQTNSATGFWANTQKTHTMTGWTAQLSLEEGIRQTVEWLEMNRSIEQRRPA